MIVLLIAVAGATATHSVQIDHQGRPITAVYSARTEVKSRTIGAHTPNRTDMRRCNWTAEIVVERRIAHAPTVLRGGEQSLSGSYAGECTRDGKRVDREIARREGNIRDHLVAVAAQDKSVLLAELDAIRTVASN